MLNKELTYQYIKTARCLY